MAGLTVSATVPAAERGPMLPATSPPIIYMINYSDVDLDIALPEGWTAVSATSFDPDAEPESLDCAAERGRVRLTVPSIHLYKIILLERR
jgi:hypothetical protein